jgi:predicted CopG family antitoxin
MGSKNISISDEAYQRLKALKKPGESFTELIERITKSGGVMNLVGLLTASEGREVRNRVAETRRASSKRLAAVLRRLDRA